MSSEANSQLGSGSWISRRLKKTNQKRGSPKTAPLDDNVRARTGSLGIFQTSKSAGKSKTDSNSRTESMPPGSQVSQNSRMMRASVRNRGLPGLLGFKSSKNMKKQQRYSISDMDFDKDEGIPEDMKMGFEEFNKGFNFFENDEFEMGAVNVKTDALLDDNEGAYLFKTRINGTSMTMSEEPSAFPPRMSNASSTRKFLRNGTLMEDEEGEEGLMKMDSIEAQLEEIIKSGSSQSEQNTAPRDTALTATVTPPKARATGFGGLPDSEL